MNYFVNMNAAMIAALPTPEFLKADVLSMVDNWVDAHKLAHTKLPAQTESGTPILVGALNQMDRVADFWEARIRASMSYLRLSVGDVEFYKFEDSLPITTGTFKLR